jgi:hypothetical protein
VNVLFDHCVPRPLRAHLSGHDIRTAMQMGWDRLENGRVLAVAETHFDVMITSDQNIRYQQNLEGRRIAIIVLPSNNLPIILALVPGIRSALGTIQPGGWVELALP